MYLVVIAWVYVVLLMSVAEATNSTGSVLGALVTFVLYGLLPISIVVYLMTAPARNKALKKRAAAEFAQTQAEAQAKLSAQSLASADSLTESTAEPSRNPDATGHTPTTGQASHTGIPAVRKIP